MLFSTLKTVVEVIVSLVACMAMESLFDRMNWPLFNSWALMHGSFVLLFPLLFLLIHLIGKGLDNLFRHGNTATLSVTSYVSSNWRTFIALLLGFTGFMIPFISVGGLVLGLQMRRQTAGPVDKGLLTASIVVSSLGVAFALYMTLTLFYFGLMAPKP
jgi:hypothetical protein